MIMFNESEVVDVAILFLNTYYQLTKPNDSGILMASLRRMKASEHQILVVRILGFIIVLNRQPLIRLLAGPISPQLPPCPFLG